MNNKEGIMYIIPPISPPGNQVLGIEQRIITEPPTLEEMQKEVGGYVEMICNVRQNQIGGPLSLPGIPDMGGFPFQMYVDEDGRSKKLLPNIIATDFYRTVYSQLNVRMIQVIPRDYLVGKAVLLIGRNVIWT